MGGLNGSLGMGMTFSAVDHASSVIKQIGHQFTALDDNVNKFAKSLDKSYGMLGKSFEGIQGLGMALGVIGVGIGGLAAAFALADSAGKFEHQLAEIGATTATTKDQIEQLERAAMALGAAGKSAPEETVKIFRELQNSSLGAAGALASLDAAVNLTAASFGRLAGDKAASLMVIVMENFPQFAGKATDAADALARAVKNAGIPFEDLPTAMKSVAKGANLMGASLEDTLGIIGLIKDRMGGTQEAVAGLNLVMMRLSMAKAGDKLGGLVSITDSATGKMRPLADILGELTMNMQGYDEATRRAMIEQAFGARSFATMGPLMDELNKRAKEAGGGVGGMTKAIGEMRAQMSDANVTAETMAEDQRNTWDGLKEAIGTSLATIKMEVGLAFNTVLKPVLMALRKSITFVVSAFVGLPKPIKTALASFFLLASAATVIAGLGMAFVALLPVIKLFAVAAVGGFIVTFGKVLLIMGVVIAAAYALKKAWESNFGGIRDAVMPIVEKITLAIKSLIALFSEGEISGALAEDLMKAENKGVFGFVQGVSRAVAAVEAIGRGIYQGFSVSFDLIEEHFGNTFASLASAATKLLGAFGKIFSAIGRALGMEGTIKGIENMEDFGRLVGSILGNMATGIAFVISVFADLIDTIASVVDVVSEVFGGFFQVIAGTLGAIVGLFSGNMDAVLGSVTSAINGAIGIINGLIEATAKVVGIVSNSKAEAIRGLKMDEMKPSQVASGFGASDQTVARLGASENDQGASQSPGGGSTAGVPSSTPGRAPAMFSSPPDSTAGVAPQDPGQSDKIVGAIQNLSDRLDARPIVVQSEIMMDGRKLASHQSAAARDQRAQTGRIQPWGDH